MSLQDWRRSLEVNPSRPGAGAIFLEVTDAGAGVPAGFRHGIRLEVEGSEPLDYYGLGELLDQLREAMNVLLALQGDPLAAVALTGLEAARNTPRAGGSE